MPSLALHRRSLDLPSGLYLDIEGAAPDLLRGGGLRLTRSHLGLALQLHEGGGVFPGVQVGRHDHSLGDTLSDLDRLYGELTEDGQSTGIIRGSGCAYSLGRGLFLDLYGTLGDEAFRRGFGRLYVAMRDGERDDECSGLERGLCNVRAAFVADAAPEAAALAGPVIARWYYGPRQ